MKKIFGLILSLVIALSFATGLVGCGGSPVATTRATVEINPQVEFMLDKNDKVVSVTGLNEEGELIISGEAFIGKNFDDAVTLFVDINVKAGYLVKGTTDELEISFSGDKTKAQTLLTNIRSKVNEKLSGLGILLDIEGDYDDTLSDLRKILLEINPLLEYDDIKTLTEAQIIEEINYIRYEARKVIGKATKEAYYQLRAYELHLAESEQIKKVINGLNLIEQALASGYLIVLDSLNLARKTLVDTFALNFVGENSAYQLALKEVFIKKQEVLSLQKQIADEVDILEKQAKLALLTQAKSALSLAENALDDAEDLAEQALQTAIKSLDEAEALVKTTYLEVVGKIPSLKNALTSKASAIDKAVNGAKKGVFNSFEKAYGESVNKAKSLYNDYKDLFVNA